MSMRSTRMRTGERDVHRRLPVFRRLTWALLIVNFPVAVLIIHSVIDVGTRYTVSVINERSGPIQSLIITAPGVRVELGPISSNGRARKHLRFSGDGSLEFEAHFEQSKTNGVVEEYVTPNLGGAKTVRVKNDGHVEIE